MKYLVPNYTASFPRVHISKEGRPLCGRELDNYIEREGTSDAVEYCVHCQQRYHKINTSAMGSISNRERVLENIRRCKEHAAEAAG